MEVVVVVKVTVPIDVEGIDDAVVVVINVVPVADAITVPVVELRERGSSSLTAWVWVDGVRVGLRWAVPRRNIGSGIERERVVLVLDVVVVKVVRKVGTAHGKVAEVVGGLRAAHVNVEPVVDTVVVLVEGAQEVIVKVVVVIDFTIDGAIEVTVCTGDFEVHAGDAAHGNLCVRSTARDGQDIAGSVSRTCAVDGNAGHHATAGDDVEGETGPAAGGGRGGDVVAVHVAASTVGQRHAGGAAVLKASVIAALVAVGVDLDAGVGDTVVVVIGVNHVEDAVVVVIRISGVRRPVIVVVGVEEVGGAVAVEVAVNDGGEGGGALSTKGPETGGGGAGGVHAVSLPVHEVNTAGVGAVFVERPRASSVVERGRG